MSHTVSWGRRTLLALVILASGLCSLPLPGQSAAADCIRALAPIVKDTVTIDLATFRASDLAVLNKYDFFRTTLEETSSGGSLSIPLIAELGASYDKHTESMTQEHREAFLRFQETARTCLQVRRSTLSPEAARVLEGCFNDPRPVVVRLTDAGEVLRVTVELREVFAEGLSITRIWASGVESAGHATMDVPVSYGKPQSFMLPWKEGASSATILVEIGRAVFGDSIPRVGPSVRLICHAEGTPVPQPRRDVGHLTSFDCHNRKWDDLPGSPAPHGGSWGRADKFLVHHFHLSYKVPDPDVEVILEARADCESVGPNGSYGKAFSHLGEATFSGDRSAVTAFVGNHTGPRKFWLSVQTGKRVFEDNSFTRQIVGGKVDLLVPAHALSARVLVSVNNQPAEIQLVPSIADVPAGVKVDLLESNASGKAFRVQVGTGY